MRNIRTFACFALLFLATGCSPSEPTDSAAETATETETAAASIATPTVGASCEHLGATDGALACEGNTVIICSVLTDHKWEVAQDMFQCAEGKTCTELEGNQTSCR